MPPVPIPPLQFPGLSNQGQAFISPHLRAGLTLYPIPQLEDNPFIPDRAMTAHAIDWTTPAADTGAGLVALTWSKRMGQPSGQWTAQVKQVGGSLGLDFDQQDVLDGDWADVSILRNGIRIPLCRGVVDTVRKNTVSAGGATTTRYTLSGRDHGAFFEYPITWSSVWMQTLKEIVSGLFTKRVDGKIGGRPDELFASLIKGTFQGSEGAGVPSGQWILPQALEDVLGEGKKLFDLLKVVTFNAEPGREGLRGAYYNEPQLWAVGEQTLHQTLSQWTNPLLNEYWYDLLPPAAFLPKHGLNRFLGTNVVEEGRIPTGAELKVDSQGIGVQRLIESGNEQFGTMGAIIRERPFPTVAAKKDAMWFSLPTWTIPTWLCDTIDLGRSGDQRFNLFELLADFGIATGEEQGAFSRPQWHKAGIFTHGLRAFSQTTRFFSDSEAGLQAWFAERSAWLQLLVDWYAPNPHLYQGSIGIKTLLPEIRIGHRVILAGSDPKEDMQLYVEGVDLQYQAPTQTSGAQGRTSLIVTRGFRGSDEELFNATNKLSGLYSETF